MSTINDNGLMIDINCNPLVVLKIVLLLCKEFFFLLTLIFFFDISLRFITDGLDDLLLIGLSSTRSETE